jgi:hypothetical protein
VVGLVRAGDHGAHHTKGNYPYVCDYRKRIMLPL